MAAACCQLPVPVDYSALMSTVGRSAPTGGEVTLAARTWAKNDWSVVLSVCQWLAVIPAIPSTQSEIFRASGGFSGLSCSLIMKAPRQEELLLRDTEQYGRSRGTCGRTRNETRTIW